MRLALVQPPHPVPSIASNLTQHPINLAYLAASVRDLGVESEIWDFSVDTYDESDLRARLERFKPDAMGFTCVTPRVKSGAKLAAVAKSVNPDILTVVGGVHVSSLPEQTLAEFPSFDVGVLGEGEIVMREIMSRLLKGGPKADMAEVPGTVARVDGVPTRASCKAGVVNLDELPFPARDLINFQKYAGSSSPGIPAMFDKVTQVFTSRGCPGECTFCYAGAASQRLRLRSPENVIREIEECVERYHVKHVTIEDDTFTTDPKRAERIFDRIHELGMTWDCDSRVDSVDRDLLYKMGRAGCKKIAFGVESGSPRILKFIDKDITLPQIREAFRFAREAKILRTAFMMVGSHPDETLEDVEESVKLVKSIEPDIVMVYCAVPYPGTELRTQMKKEGLVFSEDWDYYDHVAGRPVWRTRHFAPDELVKVQQRFYRRYYLRPSYAVKTLMSVGSQSGLKYALQSGLSLIHYMYSGDRLKRDLPAC